VADGNRLEPDGGKAMELTVRSPDDVERHLRTVEAAATRTQLWIQAHEGDAMGLLRSLKFEAVGCHPISDHALNVIEQINQTFTYAVALAAARQPLSDSAVAKLERNSL